MVTMLPFASRPFAHNDSTVIPQDHSNDNHSDARDVRNNTNNKNFVPEQEPVQPKQG